MCVHDAEQQYHGDCIKYIPELELYRILVIELVSCIQATAEEVEEREVSRLGRRPERDGQYLEWLKRQREKIIEEIDSRNLATQLVESKTKLNRWMMIIGVRDQLDQRGIATW